MSKLLDVMVLGVGHSIIVPHLGEVDIKAVCNTEEFNDVPLTQFGLYNDKRVKSMSMQEGQDGYIEPMYRMLSEVIVAKNYNPTDFTKEGVLKNSLHLLVGQTVYTDHYTSTQNQVGVVKETYWQESFKQGGVIIPAGINGIFKIDAKSNEKLARGIQMDPPSIHSNSVSVTFEWEPSHKFKDLWEFYNRLGTYDDKGELIRRIVTKIVSYSETSLVSQGADPFAKKIMADGKLTNIAYAKAAYYGKTDNMENQELIDNLVKRNIWYGDFKSLDTLENGLISVDSIHNTSKINNKGEHTNEKINQTTKNQKMEKEENTNTVESTQDFSKIFGEGLLTLEEGKEANVDLAAELIRGLIKEKKDLALKLKNLEGKEVIADNYISGVRTETLSAYQKVAGGEGKADENIIKLIAETNLETLLSLQKSYTSQLEDKFKLKCSKCGSHDVSRSSSLSEEEDTTNLKETMDTGDDSITSTLKDLAKTKLK